MHNKDNGFKEDFKSCINRNKGIISITKEGIEETRTWAEEESIININESSITIDVSNLFWEYKSEEDLKESYCDDDINISKFKIIETKNLHSLNIDELKEIKQKIFDLVKNKQYIFILKDVNGKHILGIIE